MLRQTEGKIRCEGVRSPLIVHDRMSRFSGGDAAGVPSFQFPPQPCTLDREAGEIA